MNRRAFIKGLTTLTTAIVTAPQLLIEPIKAITWKEAPKGTAIAGNAFTNQEKILELFVRNFKNSLILQQKAEKHFDSTERTIYVKRPINTQQIRG
jgi:hypothetical protein